MIAKPFGCSTSRSPLCSAPCASAIAPPPVSRTSCFSGDRLKTQSTVPPAGEGQHRLLHVEEPRPAGPQLLGLPPEPQHRPVELEHRLRVARLPGRVARRLRLLDRQPRPPGREAARGVAPVPDHRRAAAVAPDRLGPEADALRVGQLEELELGLGLPELLALVDADRPLERQEQRPRQLGQRLRPDPVLRPARHVPPHVVVREGPGRPPPRRPGIELLDLPAEVRRIEPVPQHLERIALMQPLAGRVLAHHPDRVVALAHLAHHRARLVLVEERPHLLEEGEVLRLVLREEMVLHPVGIGLRLGSSCGSRPDRRAAARRGSRSSPCRAGTRRRRAPARSASSTSSHVLHLRVVEVEVRLLGEEVVQVVLVPPRVPGPGRPAEDREPVVGRRARRASGRPRRTSRPWGCRGSTGSRRRRDAGPTSATAPGR